MDNKEFVFPIKILSGLFVLGFISGCSTFDRMGALNNASDSKINSQDIAAYASNQDEVYQALLQLAGLPGQPASTDEWSQFIMAGVQYSNQKCENYLDAVNWAKQGRHRDASLLGQTGTFANSVMGIGSASARELALTAAAFGYTQSGFDTLNDDALAGLEVSTARNLVHNLQQQYVDQLNTNQYTNRVGAFNALQGYIRLCMPGTIEAEANNAVRGSKPVSNSMGGGVNVAPYISHSADATSTALPGNAAIPDVNVGIPVAP
jgi:hypothetical protein